MLTALPGQRYEVESRWGRWAGQREGTAGPAGRLCHCQQLPRCAVHCRRRSCLASALDPSPPWAGCQMAIASSFKRDLLATSCPTPFLRHVPPHPPPPNPPPPPSSPTPQVHPVCERVEPAGAGETGYGPPGSGAQQVNPAGECRHCMPHTHSCLCPMHAGALRGLADRLPPAVASRTAGKTGWVGRGSPCGAALCAPTRQGPCPCRLDTGREAGTGWAASSMVDTGPILR